MHRLQGLGDHQVAVDRDGQEVYHGGDAEQGAAERVHLATYDSEEALKSSRSGEKNTMC